MLKMGSSGDSGSCGGYLGMVKGDLAWHISGILRHIRSLNESYSRLVQGFRGACRFRG